METYFVCEASSEAVIRRLDSEIAALDFAEWLNKATGTQDFSVFVPYGDSGLFIEI